MVPLLNDDNWSVITQNENKRWTNCSSECELFNFASELSGSNSKSLPKFCVKIFYVQSGACLKQGNFLAKTLRNAKLWSPKASKIVRVLIQICFSKPFGQVIICLIFQNIRQLLCHIFRHIIITLIVCFKLFKQIYLSLVWFFSNSSSIHHFFIR